MTGINRRHFSLLLAGSLISPNLLSATHTPLLASATRDKNGQHQLCLVGTQGELLLNHPLPGRAHQVALNPKQPWLAIVARRPGTFIDLVDYQSGQLKQRINSGAERHFYGHAIFSPDGRYLISTENNINDGQGRVVIRDRLKQFAVIADHPSYGIGPHELAMMPDNQTLVVANGGILTHPGHGREKLNLDIMQPSLVYIDVSTGALLEQHHLPTALHQLSIRHLDVNTQADIIIALQYQGDKHDDVPLVAVHRRGEALQLLRAPDNINRAMKQYCGSACFDQSGRYAAISSPRGNLVTLWDMKRGQFIQSCPARDGCGLASTQQAGEFLISSGLGRIYRYSVHTQKRVRIPVEQHVSISWDNHMTHI